MKEDVLVYGVGHFLKRNEEMVSAKYDINAFIDREKNGYTYKGKNIISINEIKDYHFAKIVIMIQDLNECHKIKEMLDNM